MDVAFKRDVDFVAEQMNGELIFNIGIIGGWYLFNKILSRAAAFSLPVTIISGRMRADFYNCLLPHLTQLITRRVPVHAYLVEAAHPDVHLSADGVNYFAQALIDASRDPEIAACYSLTCKFMPYSTHIPHIICAGERGEMFRVEKDPDIHEAVASFCSAQNAFVGETVASELRKYIKEIEAEHCYAAPR